MVCFCGEYASSAAPCTRSLGRLQMWLVEAAMAAAAAFCCLENRGIEAMVGWGFFARVCPASLCGRTCLVEVSHTWYRPPTSLGDINPSHHVLQDPEPQSASPAHLATRPRPTQNPPSGPHCLPLAAAPSHYHLPLPRHASQIPAAAFPLLLAGVNAGSSSGRAFLLPLSTC